MNRPTPPLVKNQVIQIHIDSLNHEGEGVGRFRNFAVFVPGAAPGDMLTAKVISIQKNYARALIESIQTPSPHRVPPLCNHYNSCGGCHLQHIGYEEQLRLKRELVIDALKRLGGLDVPVLPVIGMDNPWRYRNKAQVPVGTDGQTIVAGFYEPKSHRIVDVKCCHIQQPENDKTILTAKKIIHQFKIPVYSEATHRGLIRHIMVRTSFDTGETLLVLITNGHHIPNTEELISALRTQIPNLTGIVQNINTRKGNVILGNEYHTLWGKPHLEEKLGRLTFHISPGSFFQVNTIQTKVLYDKVREYASLTGTETVFDLYCGIGTISLYLASQAKHVIGVESVPSAVEDAKKNAVLNQITNASFHLGTAEETVPRLLKQNLRADVVITDPPRKGCDARLLETIIHMSPRKIIYVSCNPATLARDLKTLTQNGYTPVKVQPVDMFPHTAHVECVTLMSKVEK